MGTNNGYCDVATVKYTDDYMKFFDGGLTTFPRKSYGIFFMASYVHFGLLPAEPDYKTAADKLIMSDLYAEVAKELAIPIPDDDMKPFDIKILKKTFDPNTPSVFAKAKMLAAK